MFVMIDNYDSFVHNLVMYFRELGQEVLVVRNDSTTLAEIDDLYKKEMLQGIILSPGPKSPAETGVSSAILRGMEGKVPILGVCLGHQIIGCAYGARVEKGVCPMHGKVTGICHRQKGIFEYLPLEYKVTRYHSLVVCEDGLPSCLQIDAWDEKGTIMAVSHRWLPVYGIQFHPEAVLTEYGHRLLENYIRLCENWGRGERYAG